MATLTNRTPATTYRDLLQVSNSNSGVDTTLRYITDGEGTSTVVEVSTTQMRVNGLTYPTADGTVGQFIKTDGAGNLSFATVSLSYALDDLSDVTVTSVASGEVLKYDGAGWINNTLAEAGISAVGHTHTASEVTDLATASVAFSNKTGNISQWTNDSNYITVAGVPVPTTITVANEATDTSCYIAFFTAATGDLGPKTNTGLTFNSSTAVLTATGFAGPLTGDVTGNVSGSSGSCTGNAATATALETARAIGGVNFDGTAAITPANITIANEASDTTCFVLFTTAATGALPPKSNTSLTFNSSTGNLGATTFTGAVVGDVTGNVSGSSGSCTGNAATATLAATVTTNANLTGPITSTGNATAIASQTGTGTKFVVDTSPTLVTPDIGVATATSVNKVAITAPTTSATITIADGQTLTVDGSATITNGTHSGTNTGDQTDVSGNAGTVTVADAAGDTTTWVLLGTSQTGSLSPATDAGLTYNATTNALTATSFVGDVTGNVSGSAGSCTGNSATVTTNANLTGEVTSTGNAAVLDKTAITNRTADASPDGANDYVLTYDADAAALKKVLLNNLPGGAIEGTAVLSTGEVGGTKFLREDGDGTCSWQTVTGATLGDADYGDITVSSSGTVLTIDNDAVTYAKIQNVSATDKILGRSTAGAGDVEEIDCTAAGRALLDDADAATQRTTLGLAIGTDVQAYDAELAALAGLTSAADKGIQFTGSGTAATYDLTTAGKALLDDATAADQRTTLGLGTIATQAASSVSITGGSVTGITDITVADGGTGVSTMTTAYAPVCAGTTATGALQVASTGLSTAGYVLTSNGASALPSFQAAAGGGGASCSFDVNQSTHGLSVGNLVYCSGSSTYAKATADTAAHAEVIGIVSAVADTDNFTLLVSGQIDTLSSLTAATVYFLDPSTAGAYTSTAPTTVGQINKPVFISTSTTEAVFINQRGQTVS